MIQGRRCFPHGAEGGKRYKFTPPVAPRRTGGLLRIGPTFPVPKWGVCIPKFYLIELPIDLDPGMV
jgi:hypothetical protein